jgi:hypothetical protein
MPLAAVPDVAGVPGPDGLLLVSMADEPALDT